MNLIKKINLKTAAYINIAIILLVIFCHLLIVFQIIPFSWVNGGRSLTFESQKQSSLISISILFLMIPINVGAMKYFLNKFLNIILKILLYGLFIYFALSLIMQLFGTLFEKTVMSILCLISALMYLRLAIEKRI